MTDYERGFADCRERAAKECRQTKGYSFSKRRIDLCNEIEEQILSLQPEGADQRGTGEDSRAEQSCENRAPHHNPGEQVSSVENPDSLSVGARPARPGPCVSVPRELLNAVLSCDDLRWCIGTRLHDSLLAATRKENEHG